MTEVYVALLRGINVGGNNMVKMSDLREEFEKQGFGNVQTYINSGNVIFTDRSKDPRKLEKIIEEALDRRFSKAIRVLVRSFDQMKELDLEISKDWQRSVDTKVDVMFLAPAIDKTDLVWELRLDKSIEEFKYFPGVLLWAINRRAIGRSKMSQIVGTNIYREMSIRNPNTVRKIVELMEKVDN